jgi:hypothetical protein
LRKGVGMSRDDRLLIELLTMSFASYVHSLAVMTNTDSRNRPAIDQTWEDFKKSAASIFSSADANDGGNKEIR